MTSCKNHILCSTDGSLSFLLCRIVGSQCGTVGVSDVNIDVTECNRKQTIGLKKTSEKEMVLTADDVFQH